MALTIFNNITLSGTHTNNQTSTVGEPSVANNGGQIFYSGNWYASKSLDAGATWTHVNPYNFLPPPNASFCCDQTLIYDPSRDLTFWILQYVKGSNGENTLRLAVKNGPTLGNNQWYWWDFVPSQMNSDWGGEWFDYNHAALSNNFLYVGTNMFTSRFTRCVIFRIPLDDLTNPNNSLNYNFFESTTNGSLRCTQGARDIMYFGSREPGTNNQIRVFEWPENTTNVASQVVTVSPYRSGNGYSAPGPDGNNWLGRCDPRITAAWVSNGIIGFMWSVNRTNNRPFPYIKAVILDLNMNVIREPDIWSNNMAYAYPDASPNDRGEIGISLFCGGGTRNPSHVVGIWDDQNSNWQLQSTVIGTDGPSDGKWGDYVTCRRHSPDGFSWIASGFTLQGGNQRRNIHPLVIHFGNSQDSRAVNRWHNT